MNKSYSIKSDSSDSIYQVTFGFDNGLNSINCTCAAADNGTVCKHRAALMNEDYSKLVSKKDIESLKETISKIDFDRYSKLFSEVDKIDLQIKKLDIERKKLKKEAARKLAEGF